MARRLSNYLVAFMAFRVVRARLDRLRDGLLVFFVGVVLFRVAAAVYSFADLLVAAAPVVMLASGVAIARLTSEEIKFLSGLSYESSGLLGG